LEEWSLFFSRTLMMAPGRSIIFFTNSGQADMSRGWRKRVGVEEGGSGEVEVSAVEVTTPMQRPGRVISADLTGRGEREVDAESRGVTR
jgi:hypothetical protein